MIPREEIIHMAREAGFQIRGDVILTKHSSGAWVGVNKELESFAAQVEARAAAAEREACANLCDRHVEVAKIMGLHTRAITLSALSAAIRARGAA